MYRYDPFSSPAFKAHQNRLAAEDLVMLLKSLALRAVQINATETLKILEEARDKLNNVKEPVSK